MEELRVRVNLNYIPYFKAFVQANERYAEECKVSNGETTLPGTSMFAV